MELVVPHEVYGEVVARGHGRPGSKEKVLTPRNKALVEAPHDTLGIGESEAIALVAEHNCTVVSDDRIARLKAKSMGYETR